MVVLIIGNHWYEAGGVGGVLPRGDGIAQLPPLWWPLIVYNSSSRDGQIWSPPSWSYWSWSSWSQRSSPCLQGCWIITHHFVCNFDVHLFSLWTPWVQKRLLWPKFYWINLQNTITDIPHPDILFWSVSPSHSSCPESLCRGCGAVTKWLNLDQATSRLDHEGHSCKVGNASFLGWKLQKSMISYFFVFSTLICTPCDENGQGQPYKIIKKNLEPV